MGCTVLNKTAQHVRRRRRRRRRRIDVATFDFTEILYQSITTRNMHLDSSPSSPFVVVLHT